MNTYDLSGVWTVEIEGFPGGALRADMRVPGTLDESGIGLPDKDDKPWHPDETGNSKLYRVGQPIATRLTRRFTYEGAAKISRRVRFSPPQGARVFVEVERARHLSLYVNGAPISDFAPPTLSTPRVFEVTGRWTGDDEIVFVSDNSYPGWPHDAILYSSAATDETQTNWNGLLGYVRLRVEKPVFIGEVRAYPCGDTLDVCVTVSANTPWRGALTLTSDALTSPHVARITTEGRQNEYSFKGLRLRGDIQKWDEFEGHLYTLRAALEDLDGVEITFGARDIGVNAAGKLTLNGRAFFMRGEANCAVFPETGYAPMTVDAWRDILRVYAAYGVNCMRFHSHTPPDAAFVAADEMGMMMQPESNHWNPRTAFEDEASYRYYRAELLATLRHLANHPSFVMFALGNELSGGDVTHKRMDELTNLVRGTDNTRLYANASNAFYGRQGASTASDFFTGASYCGNMLRLTGGGMIGPLNNEPPSSARTLDASVAAARKATAQPIFGFEVGQYEVLPDFDEIDEFHGVTTPDNLLTIKRRAEQKGLLPTWKRMVEATGELSNLCYRAEVEACLLTEGMSGLSLLGVQDFPGQGTALVGMLTGHLRPKPFPFAQPERFRRFFSPRLPLAMLDKYVYEAGECLTATVKFANYSKGDLAGEASWHLRGEGVDVRGTLPIARAPSGGLTALGALDIPLDGLSTPTRLQLTVDFCGYQNEYPLWVYTPITPICPEDVYECRFLDDAAIDALSRGGKVLLAPDSDADALPRSIKAQFSTDFWSVGTFAMQEGGMGQLIDDQHPLFRDFPTEFHTNWQWWRMATRRAVILDSPIRAIVAELDSYATLRPMAQLFECQVSGGLLMFSSMGLHELSAHIEARALLHALYRYMVSDAFAPTQPMQLEELRALAVDRRRRI